MKKAVSAMGFRLILCVLLLVAVLLGVPAALAQAQSVVDKTPEPYANFPREVSQAEIDLRLEYVNTAKSWLGAKEADGSHRPIIDIYNSHYPLALGYLVTYTDSWCAAYVSAISIECGLTDIIPTECGCDRQIKLFQALDSWEEADDYVPLPGDLIYYVWKPLEGVEDCNQATDHVGIIVGVAGDQLIVIEGNCADAVRCRVVSINDPVIRGFAIPDYAGYLEEQRA